MENNLDDILIDPLEEKQKKSKSKRWVLIGVAFALLIAVVAIVLYFVFVRKEETKGLEAVHSELEKFETFAQKQSLESQKDDEFDKLIAEIKAKHQDKALEETQKQAGETSRVQETPKDQNKDLIKALQETQGVQEMKPQENEMQKNEIQERGIQEKGVQQKEILKPQIKQDKMQDQAPNQIKPSNTKAQEGVIQKNQAPKIETKKAVEKKSQEKKSPKATDSPSKLSASSAFDSLEIPRGFYLQVGVFEKTPNAEFLNKLSSFSYRVEKFNNKGKIVNRYLVGPFKMREEAEAKILEVTQKITKPVVVEIP